MRLQKYVAHSQVASRRKAEELIKNAEIKVNDKVILEPYYIVKENDIVKYKDKVITIEEKVLYMMNKPINVISSTKDERGRKTVLDFYSGKYNIYPVGRLDYKSSGLILLTNDGDLANKLMHPRYNKDKEYIVTINRGLKHKEIEDLKKGVVIDGYKTRPIKIEKIKYNTYNIILYEGRNRQIRKMLELFNIRVISLKRIRIGSFHLGDLKEGELRKIENI